jgi:glycosyltransferase involved in cell wall biosynthesis
MVIIVYSETSTAFIERNLGKSEYSYYFVLKAFLPILEKIGRVIIVTDPRNEVDAIHRRATQDGEECVFLSFSPPHRTPLDLACPTAPVIAWEYDTIPNETWSGERHQDWRFVLNKFGRAITLSSFSADAVRSAMGPDFPVAPIPAPVFDRVDSLSAKSGPPTSHLSIRGKVMDTRDPASLLAKEGSSRPVALEIGGVIYTAVLNPDDYRKNYFELLGGFCWGLREAEDATLILKLSHHDAEIPISNMVGYLARLSPFKCRVVLIDGYLSDEDYGSLLFATTYGVNASQGEGQCIPLMESMSLGKPAVAPRHTAMIDYLSTANAFLVASSLEPAAWPQDPRGAYRALSHRIDFESLSNAFKESYRVATQQPQQYKTMAEDAKKTLERHNSDAVTLQRVRSFLAMTPRPVNPHDVYGIIQPPLNVYSVGQLIDVAAEFSARRYLGSGWAYTELGQGVWSNAPIVELHFRLAQRPTGPLRLRMNLTAFVLKEHPEIAVHVRAEDFDVAKWNFSVAQPDLVHGSWREAVIPVEVTCNKAFSVNLTIDEPASPRKLGLSADIRLLGIMLHRFSILTEARTPLEPPTL